MNAPSLLAGLFLVSAALSAPAHAQTNQVDQTESVTVTGRLDPPTLSQEIRRFVRGHARLTRIEQLARWRNPACPRVIGLPDAYGDFIVNRINTIARDAGAPTNDGECAPNVTIMFTTEPQAVLDTIRRDNPEFLGAHFINQRDALATMTRPIQGWYVTATSTQLETIIDEPMRDPPAGAAGSRLTHRLQSIFVHVLILVDQNQVAGAEIGPISDYVAMLALTDVREETWACGGLVTIMELFSTCAEAPQQLTTPDRAFLQGLYTMDLEAVVSLQRGQIATEMRTAISNTQDEGVPAPE
jgi:hypothetical protein